MRRKPKSPASTRASRRPPATSTRATKPSRPITPPRFRRSRQNFGTAQQGVGALGNALGLNGPAGTQSALTALEMTPGYQASLGAGNAGVNAAAAAGGTLNSGNQLLALQKTAQNKAAGNYNNYVSNSTRTSTSRIRARRASRASTPGSAARSTPTRTRSRTSTLAPRSASATRTRARTWRIRASGSGCWAGRQKGLTTAIPGNSILGSIGSLFSDERLKEDIEPSASSTTDNVFRYRYKGDDTTRIGVMAQEIAAR